MSDKDKLKRNRTLLVAGASWHLGRRVDRSAARESGEIAWWQPRAMRLTNQLFPPRVKEAAPIIRVWDSRPSSKLSHPVHCSLSILRIVELSN